MSEELKKEQDTVKENKTKYNRKNVDKIKRIILAAFVIMFAVPILLFIYLMIKLGSIERRLDELSLKSAVASTIETSSLETTVDMSDEDMTAFDSIDTQQLLNDTLAAKYLEATGSDAASQEKSETVEESKTDAVISNGKRVYLTFDDGPSIYTDEILDILEANGVKATFFVVHYDNEKLWPAYQRIVDDGHTLAMHSYTHIYREIYANEDAFKKDVDEIHDFLYDLTGYDCKYYRFPGGSSNNVSNVDIQLCMKYLDEQGITYFDWNSLSGDTDGRYHTAADLNASILKYVRSNEGDSVVLMHDLSDRHYTVECLQDLIDTLKAEGYEICPIDDDTPLIQHVKYDPDLIGED